MTYYTKSLTNYERRLTRVVNIGEVPMGGSFPIRVQSMTTIDTMDTKGSVDQCIRMIESGCDYVRITAPSIKEAKNLAEIKDSLREKGFQTPLIADIHFTPNAAELAARIVEKVRINPGNYADKKKFATLDYTEDTYQAELDRIRDKFSPLVSICKEYGTAMRIGTNHGSLSDRILSRYGDTPLGMVESALEFIRICEDLNYFDLVLSMKSSNPQVMVQAYRLLVAKLKGEGLQSYPLHLGVTEAGEAEDGRIKSAVGIGTLLEDGLGDTVRVSLTEAPEAEAPVAKILINQLIERKDAIDLSSMTDSPIDPYRYTRRETFEVVNFGAQNVPRVITDFSDKKTIDIKSLKSVGHFYLTELDKWGMNDLGCDYVYTGDHVLDFMLPNGLKQIVNYDLFQTLSEKDHIYPLLLENQLINLKEVENHFSFIQINADTIEDKIIDQLKGLTQSIIILESFASNVFHSSRNAMIKFMKAGIQLPVVFKYDFGSLSEAAFRINLATNFGGLFIDGLGDGMLMSADNLDTKIINETVFGTLQAARTRITKTEYISCPSCGRTLFDLQETTAMIRKKTDHLKGIKIGIMGCIVNGPGEMADADYGYVGSGKGKITLYKGQEVIKKAVPTANALDELVKLIKDNGEWVDPEIINSL
ncbi:(E)-4-hydroxy-3-methylbut-2-enyl-diphosphate synthase [Cyclobacteriaceae bacterium]|jgi:(E)-4-hydroxy-3-methylbut-2-enyl-diphosphate synthase|nr:(E)-4-hydroxy-3-methylbut-2-enyl-diphosphate synthase [Cyclobacteriaceae bacterium]|tara:strand:- start:2011 stop:3951 length:1941 start_codon:yes stop_codon:yes gene_type:complete